MNLIKNTENNSVIYEYVFEYDTVKLYVSQDVDKEHANMWAVYYDDNTGYPYKTPILYISPSMSTEHLEILLRGICLGILKVGCTIKNAYDDKKNGVIHKSDYKYVLNQMMYVGDQWMFERDGEGLELDKLGRPVKNDN